MNKLFCYSCLALISLIVPLKGSLIFENPEANIQNEPKIQWQELGRITSGSPLYVDTNDEFIGFYYTLSNNMQFLDKGISVIGRGGHLYSWNVGDLLFISTSPDNVPFNTQLKIYNANFDESRPLYRVKNNCNPFDPFAK